MKKILLASVVASLAATTALADNTDTTLMTASGKVVASLTVTADSNVPLVFPNLVSPGTDAASSTVAVTCTDAGVAAVAWTGNGSPFAAGDDDAAAGVETGSANAANANFLETGQCGKLDVTGETGYTYKVTSPNTDISVTTAVTGVTLSNISCTSANNLVIASSADTLYCGGLVTAATAAATGDYEFASTVTVVYD